MGMTAAANPRSRGPTTRSISISTTATGSVIGRRSWMIVRLGQRIHRRVVQIACRREAASPLELRDRQAGVALHLLSRRAVIKAHVAEARAGRGDALARGEVAP